MKSTKFVLLFIGLVALMASFYGIAQGDVFMDHLIGIICGASLCFGYFELKKSESQRD